MKYQPLDLSFLSNYNNAPESNQNLARLILENAGWSKPSEVTQNEIAQSESSGAPHSVSGMSRLFSLLNTPIYALGNAATEAIQNHQRDNNDSVISDIGKTLEGAGAGFLSGAKAGLVGTFGSDKAASNPQNKRDATDVISQLVLHMSPEQANDPANFEKVKQMLSKEKVNALGGNERGNLQYPNGVSDADAKSWLKQMGLIGIGADTVADPLNFVNPAGALGSMFKLAKGASDISDTVRAEHAGKFAEGLIDSANNGEINSLKPGLQINEASPEGFFNEAKNGKRMIFYPKGKKFTNVLKEPKPAGLEIPLEGQRTLTKKILTQISSGNESGWIYRAADELRKAAPDKEFTNTERFLNQVKELAKSRNQPIRAYLRQMGPDLARNIAKDVENMRPAITPAEKIINSGHGADIILEQMAKLPKRLKRVQNDIALNTISKYQSRILGKIAPTAEKIPGAMNRAIDAGANARYSGPQQVNMYQTILHNLKYASPKKFDTATNILEHVENYFKSKGAIPFSAVKLSEGANLDLSKVLRAIGPQAATMNRSLLTKILSGDEDAIASLEPEAAQRIEELKAGESLATTPGIKAGIEYGKQAADVIAKAPLAPARKIPLIDSTIANAGKIANAAGGELAGHIAKKFIGADIRATGPVETTFKANRLNTAAFLAESAKDEKRFRAVDIKTAKKINIAIEDQIESPPVKQLGGIIGSGSRAVDWLGARFNAAYGNADWRPVFLKEQASAFTSSSLRSRYLNGLRKQFGNDPELWNKAMKSAQGNMAPTGIAEVDELGNEIQKTMESLFGGSGMRAGAIAEATVTARARLMMSDLNRSMKRFGLGAFKFTDASEIKDASGITQNYSKGIDWLNSWQSWKIEDPYKFLHQIQSAVEYAVREKNMFDEVASRFGSFVKMGDGANAVKYSVNHPRLKGIYFTAEGARQGEQFVKILKEINQPGSKALQYLNHVTSKFKAAVTIYWPSHHINNLIGDVVMNWYSGVNSLSAYTAAIKVMRSQMGRYEDIKDLPSLIGPNALRDAAARSEISSEMLRNFGLGNTIGATGNAVAFSMHNGEKVTNDMIATAAHRMGILPTGRIVEDVTSDVSSPLDKIRPFGGRVQNAVQALSETRDHFPRYAQFIDQLMKSGKSFEDSIEEAASTVRKWHPDGLDITSFEKNKMKAILPFYSWMRKAIPLTIETTLTSPAKIKAYPNLIEAIQIYNGIQPEQGTTDPFPTDQLFTDWMRSQGIGPTFGGPGSYEIVNPSIPGNDVLASIMNPRATIEGYVSPFAKVPIETLTSHEMTTNQQIGGGGNNESWLDYFAKQTPVVSNIGRASGQFGVSNTVQQQGFPNSQNLINMLTGLRMTNTGQYQKSAQFDLRDYLKSRQNG